MGWEKVRRTKSKEIESEGDPSQPAKPKDPSKPPYPFIMSPSEAREFRWRWVQASTGNMDDAELVEGVKYVIDILRSNGVENVGVFVGEVERELDAKEQRVAHYRSIIYSHK